jgi:hypothetical protein
MLGFMIPTWMFKVIVEQFWSNLAFFTVLCYFNYGIRCSFKYIIARVFTTIPTILLCLTRIKKRKDPNRLVNIILWSFLINDHKDWGQSIIQPLTNIYVERKKTYPALGWGCTGKNISCDWEAKLKLSYLDGGVIITSTFLSLLAHVSWQNLKG